MITFVLVYFNLSHKLKEVYVELYFDTPMSYICNYIGIQTFRQILLAALISPLWKLVQIIQPVTKGIDVAN